MRIKLLRYILALFLCGTTTVVMAAEKSDTLLSEEFSEFTIPTGTWPKNGTGESGIWTLYHCQLLTSLSGNQVFILKILKNNNNNGYAITPRIGYFGDVILSFKYGRATTTGSNSATLKLTILNGGKFEDGKTSSSFSFTNAYANDPHSISYKIIGAQGNTQIKFENTTDVYSDIDDVVVTKDGMTLSEATDNNSVIAAHPDTTMNVKTSRTLKKGIWNTMCLPFEVSMSKMQQALGTEDFQMQTYTSYAGDVMTFTAASTIPAGTPFLIKPNTDEDIVNPTFESVTISNTTAKAIGEDGSVKFVGTYSPIDLNTNGTHLFITTTGTVAKPLDDSHNHLKGLRAYIDLTDCPSPVRLNIDGETTDIQQVAIDEERPDALYDLKGQRLQSPKKGIIIKDGKLSFIK